MSWQISEPPKAKPDSFASQDWLYQVWKFLKFGSNTVSTAVNYSAKMEDKYILVDATVGAISITLPTATGNRGKEIIVKKTDATGSTVTALPRGSEAIDGSVSVSTSARATPIRLVSDNSNWYIW